MEQVPLRLLSEEQLIFLKLEAEGICLFTLGLLPERGNTIVRKSALDNAIKRLIQPLQTLFKERLFELWSEEFGRSTGKMRSEVLTLAFRIQERPMVA